MKNFSKTAFLLFIFLFFPVVVFAQQVPEDVAKKSSYIRLPDSSNGEVAPTPNINQAIDNSVQLANLQSSYFKLLEQYRNQEQSYEVAKSQYVQLNTLASQELAVKEARQLLATRADIFFNYLQSIQLTLEQTNGIPLENKKSQLVNLTLLQEQVKVHKNTILKVADRINLDQESLNFLSTIKVIQEQSYYSLSLIRLGSIQTAYDKLLFLRKAVEDEVAARDLTASKRAEKERGFEEIDRTIEAVLLDLQPLQDSVFIKKQVNSVGQLTSLATSISMPYSKIRQVADYLQEIRK